MTAKDDARYLALMERNAREMLRCVRLALEAEAVGAATSIRVMNRLLYGDPDGVTLTLGTKAEARIRYAPASPVDADVDPAEWRCKLDGTACRTNHMDAK